MHISEGIEGAQDASEAEFASPGKWAFGVVGTELHRAVYVGGARHSFFEREEGLVDESGDGAQRGACGEVGCPRGRKTGGADGGFHLVPDLQVYVTHKLDYRRAGRNAAGSHLCPGAGQHRLVFQGEYSQSFTVWLDTQSLGQFRIANHRQTTTRGVRRRRLILVCGTRRVVLLVEALTSLPAQESGLDHGALDRRRPEARLVVGALVE